MTDKELERRKAVEIQNGELIDVNTLSPIKGGLFDTSIVGNNQWGKISLPFKVPNPAFEGSIRNLLGLTQKEFRAIMAGEMELPEHLR
jgi:DNA-directed RNA polymerase beta' subunit